MISLDDALKITLIILLLAITFAIIVQLGMILFSVNSILRDIRKVTRTATEDAYKTREFAIDTAAIIIESLVFKEFSKVKSSALGGVLKVLNLFVKNKSNP